MNNFLYVDLSMFDSVKPFDGMAAGRFTDMWGRETVFLPEELPDYVRNTKLALSSTLDANGQIVGFPIDSMNHDGGVAAGWIVDVNQAAGRDVIEFTPRWNALGTGSIGSDTMRYFSPTIDVEKKVIVGGSLTNWPATRTPEHQILLRPVELSANMQTYQAPSWFDKIMAKLELLLSHKTTPAGEPAKEEIMPTEDETVSTETITTTPIELIQSTVETTTVDLSSPEAQLLINQQAEARAAVILAQREHEAAIVNLATRLTGGTPEQPTGLPVDYQRLESFLKSIPADLYPEAAEILTAAAERDPINFAEAGHSRVVQGTKPLPDAIKLSLTDWLSNKLPDFTVASFFEANAVELGPMSDYNLTEFMTVEEK